MNEYDYEIRDLYNSLSSLMLNEGDVLFIHSNIGFFGKMKFIDTENSLCNTFYTAIKSFIGDKGTICVPTFTYSYPRNEVYDNSIPSRMGVFSEFIRSHPASIRSDDPCYSVAAIGPMADKIVVGACRNSFSKFHSPLARMWSARAKILNFNFDAGSTFIHLFERNLSVPYRFDKEFHGESVLDGVSSKSFHKIYVRYLHPLLEAEFTTFDQLARKHGLFRTAKLGRGEMGIITVDDTYKLIKETLPSRPWFLTKAELTGEIPENYKHLR